MMTEICAGIARHSPWWDAQALQAICVEHFGK